MDRSAPARALPEIISVQYLRGIAALSLVIFHALGSPRRFPSGAAGVDLFFVISGFIIWTLTRRAETSPATFLWRRIVRVVPVYWVATLVTAAVWLVRPRFLWMPPFDWRQLFASLLFLPHLDGWGRIYPVLTQGWTLNYEMFFYGVFALVLVLPRRAQMSALTLLFVALVALGIALQPGGPAGATYLNPLLLEFLAGVWLGWAWGAGLFRSRAAGIPLMAIGVAIFVGEDVLGVFDTPWRALVWGGPAVLVVAGALSVEGAGLALRSPILKAVGDGSYSIYLFHPLIVALGLRVLTGAPEPVRVLLIVVACAAAGMVLHRVLELPLIRKLRRAGRRELAPPPPEAAQAGAGLAPP